VKVNNVNRIICKEEMELVRVEFKDYENRNQIKDFYKLLKKGSGYLLLEYRENEESIDGITNNSDSIKFGWNKEYGCFVSADRKDIKRFIEVVYKMLCYRYKVFSNYIHMLSKIIDIEPLNESVNTDGDNPDYANDNDDIIEEINRLLSLYKCK
jgi:hypothetical protein